MNIDPLYCPLNYRPCKWSDTDEVQCITREHWPCTNTRKEYREWYEDEEIYPCQSPAQWNEDQMVQGLSCKFDEDGKKFAYLTDQPVLSRQTSEMAERPDRIIPRFNIRAHGAVGPGTTTIPPNMSLTTWGAWGKWQWNYINDRIDNLLSTKRERLTAEDIQKIYKDVPKYYQCSMNTFPPTWKDVNLQNKRGDTPLMEAISMWMFHHGFPDIEVNLRNKIADRLFQDSRVDVDLQNKRGDTALMMAIMFGCPEIADRLFQDSRVDVNLQNKSGDCGMTIPTQP